MKHPYLSHLTTFVFIISHSPTIVRVIKDRRLKWAGLLARIEEATSAFNILTGKPTEKRPLGRPRRRWEDNIRMNGYQYEKLG